jgi:dihydrofolate synthase/folylpolyglutamate synthase
MFLGPIEGAPLEVIQAEAARRGATTHRAASRIHPRLGLAGPHQQQNADVAWALAERLGASPNVIETGLARAEWPGRMERIDVATGPLAGPWLLDAAHNPDGAAALGRALEQGGKVGVLVFGALADKSWAEMLDALAPRAAARVYVAPPVLPGLPRAATDPRVFAERHPGETAPSVAAALETARAQAGPQRLIVVAGSIFLAGEARAVLLGLPRDPPVAL